MNKMKDWTDWIRRIPEWVKSTTGLVTILVSFFLLFKSNFHLGIVVFILLAIGTLFLASLYFAFSKKESQIIDGTRIYRYPNNYRHWALAILFLSVLSSLIILVNDTSRQYIYYGFIGTPTPQQKRALPILYDNYTVSGYLGISDASFILLKGHVLDDNDNPIKDVYITQASDWSANNKQNTDANGLFEIAYNTLVFQEIIIWYHEPLSFKIKIGESLIEGQFTSSDKEHCFSDLSLANYYTPIEKYCSVVSVGYAAQNLSISEQEKWREKASDLAIERIVTAQDQDASQIYEIWIRNPSDHEIRITNVGLTFQRYEPNILCCCPTGEPYNYLIDASPSANHPNASFVLERPIETVNDEPPSKNLQYLGLLVSRQWCNNGLMILTFPTNVILAQGENEIVRLIFTKKSFFYRYKPSVMTQNALSENPYAGEASYTFEIYLFDDYGNILIPTGQ